MARASALSLQGRDLLGVTCEACHHPRQTDVAYPLGKQGKLTMMI
jgi:hypothetical protein